MDRPESTHSLSGWNLAFAVGILLLAAALRWYNLAAWDMWTDEVQTLWTAMSGEFKEGPMYRTAPVNFWLTGLAVRIFGESELGVRFIPWLTGVATVAVFLWSAARWFGPRVSLFGGLFLTLSMWHVGWSQTGRHFALQTLLVMLALHFFFVAWLGGRRWGAWISASVLFIGLFTHSSTAFFVAAILMFLGVGWLAAIAGEADRKPSVWIRAAVPYAIAMGLYLTLVFGIGRLRVANKTPWKPPWNIVGSLLFYVPPWLFLTALAGVFLLAARRQLHVGVLLLFLILVPAVLVTVSSAVTIASAAYCLASLPAAAILIGTVGDWLLDVAKGRFHRYAACALIAGFFLAQGAELAHYYFVYNGLKPRWEQVSRFVEQRRVAGEGFYAAEGDVAQFYLGRGNASWIGHANLDTDPTRGAWYAVYTGGGPFSATHGPAFRTLQGVGELIEVFPVHYGAKDRTLAVFYVHEQASQEN